MNVEVDLFGANKCGGCYPRGSGRCGACFGTGHNTHLNSPDPNCSQCSGTGVCQICKGSGKAQGAYDKPWPMPIGLRLAVSIFPLIMLFAVMMGSPVHWGRGDPVMPRWLGVVLISTICGYVLKVIWTKVTLADMREFYFNLRHPTRLESLFDEDKPEGRGTTRE